MTKNNIVNNISNIHTSHHVVGIVVKENNYFVYLFQLYKPLLIRVF